MWVHPGKREVVAQILWEASYGWVRVSGGQERGRGRAFFKG